MHVAGIAFANDHLSPQRDQGDVEHHKKQPHVVVRQRRLSVAVRANAWIRNEVPLEVVLGSDSVDRDWHC